MKRNLTTPMQSKADWSQHHLNKRVMQSIHTSSDSCHGKVAIAETK